MQQGMQGMQGLQPMQQMQQMQQMQGPGWGKGPMAPMGAAPGSQYLGDERGTDRGHRGQNHQPPKFEMGSLILHIVFFFGPMVLQFRPNVLRGTLTRVASGSR